jgi:hypothetical protein
MCEAFNGWHLKGSQVWSAYWLAASQVLAVKCSPEVFLLVIGF